MTRTRLIFYLILVAVIAVVAVSLTFQVMSEALLTQIFVAATVFSAGVVILDLVGILGSDHDGGSDDGAGAMDQLLDLHPGHELSHEGLDHDPGVDSQSGNGHPGPVLSVLAFLRMLVYFALGFGPVGWFAIGSGRSPLVALVLASASGVLSTLMARAFFRIQRTDTDSTVPRRALVQEEAIVIIPVSHESMGKVRVRVGPTVTEQYALADIPDSNFDKGESVRIVRVTDECVYVA